MTYELAKQLKDSGFPLKQCENDFECDHEHVMKDAHEIFCLAPTLSELIEACGDDFEGLTKVDKQNNWWVDRRGNWPDGEAIYGGSTPEEAVAKLWLALNKK